MNILLLGSGGREHALAWKLAQSPLCETLWAAPGNPGIAEVASCIDLDVTDHAAVIAFCETNVVGLVVIGPEAPLVDGLGDSLRAEGFSVFGPNRQPAQLEGSKGFTKDLCERAGIPTAGYERVSSEAAAMAALARFGAPVVIKADGLAAGKGVTVAMTMDEAEDAVREIFSGRFGDAGAEAVIEEFMEGEEASFFALTDGSTIVPFASAQDHKRVGDGDTGPNTGGMGAYSPAPVVTPQVHERVMREVVEPTVAGMIADGVPFTGFLYAGLMIDASGAPKVIEFNVRFGDPETQPVMLRLQSDLVDLVEAAIDGRLDEVQAQWDPRPSLGVVIAARPYPDTPVTGEVIEGLDAVPANAKVFHAGTALDADGRVVSAGGRVLCVAALGDSVAQAQANAYAGVDRIGFEHAFHRRDIGWRAIAREQD